MLKRVKGREIVIRGTDRERQGGREKARVLKRVKGREIVIRGTEEGRDREEKRKREC